MANRYQTRERQIIYNFLADRDGEKCFVCPARPPKFKLEIDHADTNPKNDDPENLHLVCSMHNQHFKHLTIREHKNYLKNHGAVRERVRERAQGGSSTRRVKQLLDYNDGSQEMRANYLYELQYRDWILKYLIQYKVITRKEAANSGAEIVGCSQLTISRYLEKLTSAAGPLERVVDEYGIQIIRFRR